jgi:hypothetical protein
MSNVSLCDWLIVKKCPDGSASFDELFECLRHSCDKIDVVGFSLPRVVVSMVYVYRDSRAVKQWLLIRQISSLNTFRRLKRSSDFGRRLWVS